MKKIPFAALLALTGVGLVAQTAHAGTTSYASNGDDLFLGFRQDGNSTADILIDLGQASLYRGGFSTVIGSQNGIIGTGLGALLTSSFGSGWFTDPTVHWGLTATSGGLSQTAGGVTEFPNTLYISNPESNSNIPTSQINATQSTATSAILTMEGQWVGLATSTGLLNGRVETPSSTSWAGSASNQFNDATQFGNFEDNPNASSALDLYRLTRSSNTSSSDGLRGTFTINSSGQVTYSAAVPEPTAISLLGGAGLLLLVRRRRNPAVA